MMNLDFDMADFGKNLKKFRVNAGLSVKDISELLGVSIQAVYDYQRGAKFPRADKLALLIVLFNEGQAERWVENSEETEAGSKESASVIFA